MKKLLIIECFALGIMLLGTEIRGQDRKQQDSFALDPQKPFVYLRFDQIAPGKPWGEDEPPLRIWLELVNNSRAIVEIRTFGGPDEAIGVMDNVVEDTPPSMVISREKDSDLFRMDAIDSSNNDSTGPTAPSQEKELKPRRPYGYGFDVSSLYPISPGKRVRFSLPVNHLGKTWHIEIPFTFSEPAVHCCRDEKDGGEPVMHILYGLWDLPKTEQQKILKFK